MSLLQFKPAPMYILDEVDAALDLSHTQHIGHLFRTRFHGSQFIVVSLKEGLVRSLLAQLPMSSLTVVIQFTNANVLFRTRFRDGTSIWRVSSSFRKYSGLTRLIFQRADSPAYDKYSDHRAVQRCSAGWQCQTCSCRSWPYSGCPLRAIARPTTSSFSAPCVALRVTVDSCLERFVLRMYSLQIALLLPRNQNDHRPNRPFVLVITVSKCT